MQHLCDFGSSDSGYFNINIILIKPSKLIIHPLHIHYVHFIKKHSLSLIYQLFGRFQIFLHHLAIYPSARRRVTSFICHFFFFRSWFRTVSCRARLSSLFFHWGSSSFMDWWQSDRRKSVTCWRHIIFSDIFRSAFGSWYFRPLTNENIAIIFYHTFFWFFSASKTSRLLFWTRSFNSRWDWFFFAGLRRQRDKINPSLMSFWKNYSFHQLINSALPLCFDPQFILSYFVDGICWYSLFGINFKHFSN